MVGLPALTAELFTIPLEEGYLIYAPLRQAALLADGTVVNQIADLRDGTASPADPQIAELVGLLRELGIVDGGPEEPPAIRFSGDPKPTLLTLFLTTSCNLRCTYCYAKAGDTPKVSMPLDVAQRGIDFVIRNALELGRDRFEIVYHGGGEPSVNWDTLRGSFEYARQRAGETGLRFRAAMASNGVLPDFKIDWIIAHLAGISLSFDGSPEAHDANRLTVLGQGSAHLVERTIRRFEEAQFNYSLRVTVTHDQIARMPESIAYICQRYHPARIQVEPAYPLGRWSAAPAAETQAFIDNFRAARAIAREYGQDLYFSAARLGTLSNHFCGLTQDSFALTANGSVSGCYEVFLESQAEAGQFMYGRYDENRQTYAFNLPVLNNLRAQTVDRHEFCRGCFAKWNCGGDCYHKSVALGQAEFAGSDRCHIIRELTKDQILERIAASGGTVWHETETAVAGGGGKEVLV